MAKEFERLDLGDGYYIIYRMVSNMRGGYHPVNIMLFRDDELFVNEITDEWGNFVDFPETIPGEWSNQVGPNYYNATLYVTEFSEYIDHLCCVSWMVQPDGRYWTDADGFGHERTREVWLYALLDKNGKFVTPFSEKRDERYKRCMVLR